jgi:hypothetical protein
MNSWKFSFSGIRILEKEKHLHGRWAESGPQLATLTQPMAESSPCGRGSPRHAGRGGVAWWGSASGSGYNDVA